MGGAPAPAPGAPEGPSVRWRLDVAYNGTGFHGFAAQPGVRTVAGTLSEALARTTRATTPPLLTCAGRTDAGVHARGQVVHVDLPATLPPRHRAGEEGPMTAQDLVRAVNRQVGPAVVVRSAAPAPEGFDARRSATARHYRYLVHNAPTPDPLLAELAWHVPGALDLRAMAAAADTVLGEHDFRAFCRRSPGTPAAEPIVRRVLSACWTVVRGPGEGAPQWPGSAATAGGPPACLLRFDVTATSFCHQMVRSLVAELVAVGQGRSNVAAMAALLRAGNRSGLAQPAPPYGLCLESVSFG